MLFALIASDATYPMVAEAFALPESTALPTKAGALAVVVRGRPSELLSLALIARRAHLRASVATSAPLTATEIAALRTAGLDPIPELSASGVTAPFAARGQLRRQVTSYTLNGHFYYLAPHEGFTIVDYLLAATSEPADATSARSIPER